MWACSTLTKEHRVWTYFCSFKFVDNRCVCKREILIYVWLISILSIEVNLLYLGHSLENLSLFRYIMLMKSVVSPFSFGVKYISMWKINMGGSVFSEYLSWRCSGFCPLFLSYLCSFLFNNSNPLALTLETGNSFKAAPWQRAAPCVAYNRPWTQTWPAIAAQDQMTS